MVLQLSWNYQDERKEAKDFNDSKRRQAIIFKH